MISYVQALWFRLGARTRAALTSLLVPAAMLGWAFMPEWVALLGAAVWVLLVLGGIVGAHMEHRRDRRRGLRSWRTVPHPDPCPHCVEGPCRFPPASFGLDQAPDAHLWDAHGRFLLDTGEDFEPVRDEPEEPLELALLVPEEPHLVRGAE
jgi:hypothetical protein